jgi:hypothetical protein
MPAVVAVRREVRLHVIWPQLLARLTVLVEEVLADPMQRSPDPARIELVERLMCDEALDVAPENLVAPLLQRSAREKRLGAAFR